MGIERTVLLLFAAGGIAGCGQAPVHQEQRAPLPVQHRIEQQPADLPNPVTLESLQELLKKDPARAERLLLDFRIKEQDASKRLAASAVLAEWYCNQTNALKHDQPAQAISVATKLVAELEFQSTLMNKDKTVQKDLATAYFDLAGMQWNTAQYLSSKQEPALKDQVLGLYVAARNNAQKSLTLSMKGDIFPTLEDRIAKCNLAIGTSYLREGIPEKGLDALRKAYPFAEDDLKKRIGIEIFVHYESAGLQNIVKEFRHTALAESLLDITHKYFMARTKKGEGLYLELTGGEEIKNASMLFRYLANYVTAAEKSKPEKERDGTFPIEYLFLHYAIGYSIMDEDGKNPLLEKLRKDYHDEKKIFPKMKPLEQLYGEWTEGQKQFNAGKGFPGAEQLRKALEDSREH